MADFGADVTVVEPPGGLTIRILGPVDGAGRSIPATYVLANKQSIALDLATADGSDVLTDLLAAPIDVIVQSDPATLQAAGVDLDALHEANPALVSVTITPHGEAGPRAGLPGNDLTTYAWSGWASVNGRADREPIKGSGFTASITAGVSAYGAVIAALCHRELSGRGQHIDVAETEAMAMIFGRSMLRAQYEGVTPGRNAETEMSATYPAQVADGYLTTAARGGPSLGRALRALDLDEFADRIPEPTGPGRRAPAPPEVQAALRDRLTELGREEIFDRLSPHHFSAGPVFDVGELMQNRQLRAREFFQAPSDDTDEVEFPGPPFKMTSTPAHLRTTAPAIGAHSGAVLRDLADYDEAKIAGLERSGAIAAAAVTTGAGK
jgi:formyl-CoA transferase